MRGLSLLVVLCVGLMFPGFLSADFPPLSQRPSVDAPPPTEDQPIDDFPVVSPIEKAARSTTDVDALKALIFEQLRQMSAEDLMQKVNRAHNVLSRDGQEALRDRARVRLAQEKAGRAVRRLESDPQMTKATQLLNSPEVQQDLRSLLEIEDDSAQLAAFEGFLKTHGIPERALRSLAEFRTCQAVIRESTDALKAIESYLGRQTLPVTVSATGVPSNLIGTVRAASNKYGSQAETELDTSGVSSGENLRDLLRALLHGPAVRESSGGED